MNRCLEEPELKLRLEEEMARATRQGTPLGCLVVTIEDVKGLTRIDRERLSEQALDYVTAALARQLRRYDRIGRARGRELLVVLPGADERRGELIARRALDRLHAIKLETDGRRSSLPVSVGIAAFAEGLTAEELLARARLAACVGHDEDHGSPG